MRVVDKTGLKDGVAGGALVLHCGSFAANNLGVGRVTLTRLMYVNSSPAGEASRSGAVAAAFLNAYQARRPEADVDVIDLFTQSLPPVGCVDVDVRERAGDVETANEAERRRGIRELVDRFTAADHYLFTVPMWNFGIPYVLKHFIDVVTQSGVAFRLDAQEGYSGLLTGRSACAIYTSGIYTPGCPPAFGLDFQSSYVNYWLKVLGVSRVLEISLRPTDYSASLSEDLERAKEEAREAARKL